MAPVTFRLTTPRERARAGQFLANAPADAIVEFRRPKRSLPQNALLHALLTDIASQVEWSGAKRDVEAWKDILTAALRSANHGLDVVPGINGGFVLLGMHTSQMTKAELGELVELAYAFGAQHGVRFHDAAAEGGAGANNPRAEAAA